MWSPASTYRLVYRTSWHDVELDHSARRVRVPAGLVLDLGAIAKAWCADRCASRIKRELHDGAHRIDELRLRDRELALRHVARQPRDDRRGAKPRDVARLEDLDRSQRARLHLDDDESLDSVRRKLAEAEAVARRQGFVVAIGHPHETTLQALGEWLPGLQAKGMALAPATAVLPNWSRS